MQLDLFSRAILEATLKTGSTKATYGYVSRKLDISKSKVNSKIQAGKAGMVSEWKRKVRWVQQSLKRSGLIEAESRGYWSVTGKGKRILTTIHDHQMRVAFHTDYGLMLWGNSKHLHKLFKNEVTAIITSPPYLLQNPKEYGGISNEQLYVDEFLRWAEGWMESLTPNGSIVINLGDSFKKKAFAMNLYKERILIALEEKLGLELVQRFEWWSPSKLANPIWPVCRRRTHCIPALESFFWLSPSPENVKANNRNVLVEYAASHKRLIAKGATKSAVRIRPSGARIDDNSFIRDNGGAIPHNILCSYPEAPNSPYSRYCRENDIPIHPARFPLDLPAFFVKFLTEPDDLVMDPFSGSGSVGFAAESAGRRWVASENVLEYIQGAFGRFNNAQWVL